MSNDNREPETFERKVARAIVKELDLLRFKADQARLEMLAYHIAIARAEAERIARGGTAD